MPEPKTVIVWRPQPGPQKALVDCNLPEVFFGGARGGGKTDGVLGKWALKAKRYGEHFNAKGFRKTGVSFDDTIERAKKIYVPLGAKYVGSPMPKFTFPNGARITFGYLETENDAENEQGKNLSDAWVEEAGQYASSRVIDKLYGALRSAHGVPTQLILTANPGGSGQHWIKDRYKLVPFPRGPKIVQRTSPTGATLKMAVIPSRITDNRELLESDPGYIDRLSFVGSAALVQAWLEGDWNSVEGAYFDEWSEAKHVVAPFEIPADWLRFRSMDWGSASPFSVGWWAVAGDEFRVPLIASPSARFGAGLADSREGHPRMAPPGGQAMEGGLSGASFRREAGARLSVSDAAHGVFGNRGVEQPIPARVVPRGALVRYREWYGASGPNVGLKLTAEQVGTGIARLDGDDKITYGRLDPAAFAEDGGPSIGERINAMLKQGYFTGADNRRVSQRGAMGGWDIMRQRLRGDGERPMLYVFSTCRDFIRTVPTLQHDEHRPEDLDTTAEDHVADEARYACMSRPWVRVVEPKQKPSVRKDWFDEDEDDGAVNWRVA